MVRVTCFNCEESWELSTATTNRCPKCGWIAEIYYDEAKAEEVRDIYNGQGPLPQPAGVLPLVGIDGYSVFFPPDEARLAKLAEKLLDEHSE